MTDRLRNEISSDGEYLSFLIHIIDMNTNDNGSNNASNNNEDDDNNINNKTKTYRNDKNITNNKNDMNNKDNAATKAIRIVAQGVVSLLVMIEDSCSILRQVVTVIACSFFVILMFFCIFFTR